MLQDVDRIELRDEGAFRNWGYEVARDEFGDAIVTEKQVFEVELLADDGGELAGDGGGDHLFGEIAIRAGEIVAE